jgi:hypothetical protein
MSNSTPSTPPEGEQMRALAEVAPVEEPKAPEDRLLELKREAEDMLKAERLGDLPGWKQDSLPEWMTEKQATQLYSRWLDVHIRRRQEQPDVYGPIRNHKGRRVTLMLAYCADKMLRVREIREETGELRNRRPSPRATRLAAAIVSVCESLKEIYSMTGDHYGKPLFPPPEKFRGLR